MAKAPALREMPKRTTADIMAAWLKAKTADPFIARRDFAKAHNVSNNTLTRVLVGAAPEREILSKRIADMISDCASELGVAPSDLKWSEFASHFKLLHGVHPNSASGLKSHHLSQVGGFATVRDAYFPRKVTDRAVESQRVSDHAALNRRLGAATTRQAFTLGMVERLAEKCFRGLITAPKAIPRLREQRRVVTALWSDLHFGSDIASADTGLVDYGRIEEARAFAQIIAGTADFKPQYRDTTTLRILSLGDIIEGKLHDREDGAAMAEQVCRAIHLKSQGIAYLANIYPRVDVHCVSGNHDRNTARHPGRATSHKADSYGTMINYAVKMAVANLRNVTVHIPQASYIIDKVFEAKTFATHGDGTFNPGNPGKVIAVGQLEGQINRINADLRAHARDAGEVIDDCVVFACGHIHTGMSVRLPNGAVLVTNGGLPPTNGFGVNGMGRFSANRGQYVWESVSGHPFGDSRFLNVDTRAHFNAELDKIIQPWGGY